MIKMVMACRDPRDPYDTYGHRAQQKFWEEQQKREIDTYQKSRELINPPKFDPVPNRYDRR